MARGGRERMRGHKGGLGDLPQENFGIQDDLRSDSVSL